MLYYLFAQELLILIFSSKYTVLPFYMIISVACGQLFFYT